MFSQLRVVDKNRVRLQASANDYINASHVKSQGNDKREYICTQGPQPNMFEDFWQMVYENSCPAIVMVTPVEAAKCHEYLPLNDKGQGQNGKFNVKITKTRHDGEVELRGLKIQRKEPKYTFCYAAIIDELKELLSILGR
ncbi:hypothetical protein PR202_gb16818 [Eleusine coracana subsp. coracana]|uniref:Tyrosine-protein phosphatase domain-containing protein n=1 Tax=Eleusine coracana subsp. coracana TaxID=191504 RepID=A0AAV5F2U5_ELECO|nr:hypothetical protein PR202_gb16760 [Eleusine coracana subsp. coracana]GJN28665.1 hypothetical protein PR202_gb16818 [Eleusine coracana subsp. coracana]